MCRFFGALVVEGRLGAGLVFREDFDPGFFTA
jgi:hypothetical protein